MRVKLFREVDISDLDNRPVDTTELSTYENLWVSLRSWISRGKIYNIITKGAKDREARERMSLISEVKTVILNNLYNEMKSSTYCRIRLPRQYEDILNEVLNSSEFISYKIKRIYENNDVLLSFPDLPILLEFEVI